MHCTANTAGQAKARALKLAKAATELHKLIRSAGSRYHPTEAKVTARAAEIAKKRRVTASLRTTITTGPDGKPRLRLELRPGRDRRRSLRSRRRPATAICLALPVFCLLEREARRALAITLKGFYTDNKAVRPTGRLILLALSRLSVLPADDSHPPDLIAKSSTTSSTYSTRLRRLTW